MVRGSAGSGWNRVISRFAGLPLGLVPVSGELVGNPETEEKRMGFGLAY